MPLRYRQLNQHAPRFVGETWPLETPKEDLRFSLARAGPHLGPVVLIAATGLATFIRVINTRPIAADNLVALSIASRGSPAKLFTGSFVSYVPGYRPIAHLSTWIQYRAFGLHVKPYFLLNLFIWIACALAVYVLVHSLTASRLAATGAGLCLLLDPRALSALYWIGERQSSMACLFGCLALVVAVRARDRRRVAVLAGICLLLLCAALSKEYGLAFAGATIALALADQRDARRTIGAAAFALVIYTAMRLVLAGGASTRDYCEYMGFLGRLRLVCLNELSLGKRVAQTGYNSVATLVGTVVPPLFDDTGRVRDLPEITGDLKYLGQLAVALLVLGTAGVALVKEFRRVAPFTLLVVANALLSFAVYRGRNQLVGALGWYVTAGVGVAWVQGRLGRAGGSPRVRRVAAPLAVFGLTLVSLSVSLELHQQMNHLDESPCRAAAVDPTIDARLARTLAHRYGADADCGTLGLIQHSGRGG